MGRPLTRRSCASHDGRRIFAEAIRSRGFAIHARALAPDLIAALTSAIDHIVAAQAIPFSANEFPGFRMRRVFNLLAQGEILECVPVHEALLPVAEQLLGHECLLSSLTAIEMNPGETPECEGGRFPPAAISLTPLGFASLRAAKRRWVPASRKCERRGASNTEATVRSPLGFASLRAAKRRLRALHASYRSLSQGAAARVTLRDLPRRASCPQRKA